MLHAILLNDRKQPSDMALTANERKARVRAKRGLQARVAKRLNLHPSHVGRVVDGKAQSRRVEVAIARGLGLPVKQVFPQLAVDAAATVL